MQFTKLHKGVLKAKLNAAETKAMNEEIKKQAAEFNRLNAREIDAMILWRLHILFDFGPVRLLRFYLDFNKMHEELCQRYEQCDDDIDPFVCTKLLKEYGIDLEQWEKEYT